LRERETVACKLQFQDGQERKSIFGGVGRSVRHAPGADLGGVPQVGTPRVFQLRRGVGQADGGGGEEGLRGHTETAAPPRDLLGVAPVLGVGAAQESHGEECSGGQGDRASPRGVALRALRSPPERLHQKRRHDSTRGQQRYHQPHRPGQIRNGTVQKRRSPIVHPDLSERGRHVLKYHSGGYNLDSFVFLGTSTSTGRD
jgi:hypothetical protein